jgi:hypothetical protein
MACEKAVAFQESAQSQAGETGSSLPEEFAPRAGAWWDRHCRSLGFE